jgi:hypothetical protein
VRAIGTIGRAFADVVFSDFCDSYADMRVFSEKILCNRDTFIHSVKGTYSYHSGMRNEMVGQTEGEWLYQTDTDHCYQSDILVRLLNIMKRENVSIVSGIYQYKAPTSGHGPVAGFWNTDWALTPLVDWNRDLDTLDVGAVGAGSLLVKTELFRRMRAKYGCEPFDHIGGMSEDFSFCRRAVEMGERIVLCPQIEAHHLSHRNVLSIRDYPKSNGGVSIIQTQGGIILPAETTT